MTWYLLISDDSDNLQTENDVTFFGGIPRIPPNAEMPICKLCGSQQTFFFQVAFPQGHAYRGFSLAVFQCTACVDVNHFIPQMLNGILQGIDIPEGFLESYQINFRFFVFDTAQGILRKDYPEKVRFRRLKVEEIDNLMLPQNKIGGTPNWLLEDESPGTYASKTKMTFLLQLIPDCRFELLPGSPPQMELSLQGVPKPSRLPYYQLFLGNAVYFFGTEDPRLGFVYAITQID